MGADARSMRGEQEREPVALPGEEVVLVECHVESIGTFVINTVPQWAPLGAKRFLDLVRDQFFDGTALFRAVPKFLVQFGIAKEKSKNEYWSPKTIKDDPKIGVRIRRGTLAFAGGGHDTRSAQMFVALSDHSWPHLGKEPWETPFGYISEQDMDAVWQNINYEYGDMKPWGKKGVNVGDIWDKGYDYLEKDFPNMSYLKYCKILDDRQRGKGDDVASDSVDSSAEVGLLSASTLTSDPSYLALFIICLFIVVLVARNVRYFFKSEAKMT